MSVSCTLFVNPTVSLQDVQGVIERVFGTKIEFHDTHSPDFTSWHFNIGTEKRDMNVFTNYSHAGFHGTIFSVNCWGRYKELMEVIAKVFGGFIQDESKNESWEEINGELEPHNGTSFFHRYSIITKGRTCKDVKGMVADWEEFDRETKQTRISL